MLLLPDPFLGMGAWLKTMDLQKPSSPVWPEKVVANRQIVSNKQAMEKRLKQKREGRHEKRPELDNNGRHTKDSQLCRFRINKSYARISEN